MKFAMHNWMRMEPIEVTLERLNRLGYDGIEISGEPARYNTKDVRKLLDRYKLKCWGSVTIMTEGRDLIHADKYVRVGTVAYMKDCVKMIHELGGKMFCIVPSTVGKISPMAEPDREWGWAIEGLKQVAEHADRRKVRIGIEPLNRFETYFINRHDQALALADEVGKEVGVVLDAFHINIEEEDPLKAIRTTGKRLVDFHVADNNRRPPGEGNWNWKGVIKALRDAGYDDYLTQEFVNPVDRTPLGAKGDGGSEDLEFDASQLKFIKDHGSGILTAEEYDKSVSQAITYLKKFL